jgi:hypothetical protein
MITPCAYSVDPQNSDTKRKGAPVNEITHAIASSGPGFQNILPFREMPSVKNARSKFYTFSSSNLESSPRHPTTG